ncbi:hypothetical protein ACIKTA_02590 [Hansschlegelia beijingensis]
MEEGWLTPAASGANDVRKAWVYGHASSGRLRPHVWQWRVRREVGEAEGRPTLLIEEASELPRGFVDEAGVLGVTAAASTPEEVVQELLARLASWRAIAVSEVGDPEENVRFAPVDLGALA